MALGLDQMIDEPEGLAERTRRLTARNLRAMIAVGELDPAATLREVLVLLDRQSGWTASTDNNLSLL